MEKHVLIITDSYPPEVRSSALLMKELADGLLGRGYRVTVATLSPTHNVAGGIKEIPEYLDEDGVQVLRARVLAHHNVGFFQKGISWLLQPILLFRKIKKHVGGPVHYVIVHSPPLPLTLSAYWVKKYFGAKYILNLHDIFPQNAIDLGVLKNRVVITFFERMERTAYARADVLMVPSEEHRKFLVAKRGIAEKRIAVVPHWIDTAPFERVLRTGKFRKRYGLEGKFVFLFGGVLGPSQYLDLLVRIADKVRDIPEICFLFVGEGSAKRGLRELVAKLKLTNVRFEPLVSKEEYPELVKDADVGIVSLSPKNTTPAVPAKLLGYMAGALPVVAFLHPESEALRIVRKANCGYGVNSADEEGALRIVRKIYEERANAKKLGKNGFYYVSEHLSQEACLNKLEALFSSR